MDRYDEKARALAKRLGLIWAPDTVETIAADLREQDTASRALLEEARDCIEDNAFDFNRPGEADTLIDHITAHLAGEEKGERDGK